MRPPSGAMCASPGMHSITTMNPDAACAWCGRTVREILRSMTTHA